MVPRWTSEEAEWLLLENVESVERQKHMLGAVIPERFRYCPFDNYSPNLADLDLNKTVVVNGKAVTKKVVLTETMDGLWQSTRDYGGQNDAMKEDQPVQLNDILTGKVAAKTKGIRASVTNLFETFVRRQEAEEVEIKSGLVKRYKIDNAGAKVGDNLMACEPWREQLQKLLKRRTKDNGHFFLVTGLLVCEDLEVRWKRDRNSKVNAATKVDGEAVLAAAGVPPNPGLAAFLDSRFEVNQEKSDTENVFARCKQPVIFAVRYNYLNLTTEKSPGLFAKYVLGAHPEGTIKKVEMDGVVLGRGIRSFADADGRDEAKQDLMGTMEEESLDEDWFYCRPGSVTDDLEEEHDSTSSDV